MAEDREQMIQNLLSRTLALGKHYRSQPKSGDGQRTSGRGTKQETKLKKKTKQATSTNVHLIEKPDSSKVANRKGSLKKDVFFSAIRFSSSDEESIVEVSSVCGVCDSDRLVRGVPKDGSVSVAYSTNLSIGGSDTRIHTDSYVVSATQDSLPPKPVALDDSDFVCPDSQPDSREASAIIDRLWSQGHTSLLQRDDGSFDSENLSDILRPMAPEVIPASQTSFEVRDDDENSSRENENMLQPDRSIAFKKPLPSAPPSSKALDVYSPSTARLCSPIATKINPQASAAVKPAAREARSARLTPRRVKSPHPPDRSRAESDLDQSVFMLADRLDRIMTTDKTKRQTASKTRKALPPHRTHENKVENVKHKQHTSKNSRGQQAGRFHLMMDFSEDEAENCAEMPLAQQQRDKTKLQSSEYPNKIQAPHLSTKKCHNVPSSFQKQPLSAVEFSSEEEIIDSHGQDPKSCSAGSIGVDSQMPSNQKRTGDKVPLKFKHAVSFSSDDDCGTHNAANNTGGSKRERYSSQASEVMPDTDVSVASSKADDDLALLSARCDSILCTSNKKTTNIKKTRKTKTKKKVLTKPTMLNMFSSSDEEASDKKAGEQFKAISPVSEKSNIYDPEVKDISLQVSIVSTPEMVQTPDNSGSSQTASSKLQTVAQNDSMKHLTTSGSDSSPIKQTTNKSLQVSFASQCSVVSTDESLPHMEQCLKKHSAESEENSINISPASMCNLSLQVSLSSHDESIINKPANSSLGLAQACARMESPSRASESSAPDDLLYKTALMEISGSPEDLQYITVGEFPSFEETASEKSSPFRRRFIGQPEENASANRQTSRRRKQKVADSRMTPGVVSDSDVSDKENWEPPSDSDSDSDNLIHSKLVTSSDDESSEDCFVVPESMSEDDQARNRRPIVPSETKPGKTRVVHRITFSSDESETETGCSSHRPVPLKLGRHRNVVRESLSRVVCHKDQLYDTSLPDLDNKVKRRPSVRFQEPSDSSEDDLESFLQKMKQPKVTISHVSSDSLDDFIVEDDEVSSEDDSDFYLRNGNKDTKKSRSWASNEKSPLISEDEDGEDIVIHDSAFKTPVAPPAKPKSYTCRPPPRGEREPVSVFSTPSRSLVKSLDRPNSTGHTPQRPSFLRSLSTDVQDGRRHADAIKYVKNFKKLKEELTTKLFRMYNNTVFENKIPDDLPVEWNTRLTKTAGYCTYKKVKGATETRAARIELSVKVCDSAERVRDTLIHELCHAAVWLLYGKTDGHGAYWKHWAHKANLIHPELPVISRCHSYQIQTKYTYKCSKCGYQIGRHSKSLNTDQKVCGYCHSPFELLVNTKSGPRSTPQTPRTPNKFALFVKENYGSVKKQHSKISHKDVMQKLSADFALKSKINL